jgi:hypothetical protein
MVRSAATARSAISILGAMALVFLIGPGKPEAAPFCLSTTGMMPQCLYYDAGDCRRDAGKQGGWCEPNPGETRTGYGSGQYCLLISQGASVCSYVDRNSCEVEARRQRGACYFDAQKATGAPDPYAVSNP